MKTLTEFLEDDFNDLFDLINEGITDGRPEDIKQPWNDFETDDLMHFGDHYRKNILPYIDRAEKPFRKLLFSMKTDGGKVTTGRKSIEALHDKVMTREKPLSNIHDILRGALLTRNKDEASEVVDKIKELGIVCDHDYNKIGEYDTGYGGSHHLVVDIEGTKAEIQIMPKKIWKAHQETHRIYKKYRSMENPAEHPDYEADIKNSRKLFRKAHKAWQRHNS